MEKPRTVAELLLADTQRRERGVTVSTRISALGVGAAGICAAQIKAIGSQLQSKVALPALKRDVEARGANSPAERARTFAGSMGLLKSPAFQSIVLAAALVGFAGTHDANAQSRGQQRSNSVGYGQSEVRRDVITAEQYGRMCLDASQNESRARAAMESLERNPVQVRGDVVFPNSVKSQLRVLLPAKISGVVRATNSPLEYIPPTLQAGGLDASGCWKLTKVSGQYRGSVNVSNSGVRNMDSGFSANKLYADGSPIGNQGHNESWDGSGRQPSGQYSNRQGPTNAAIELLSTAVRGTQGGGNLSNMATGRNVENLINLAGGLLGGNRSPQNNSRNGNYQNGR